MSSAKAERMSSIQVLARYFLIFVATSFHLAWPSTSFTDQAQYIYDELGRLAGVIDGQGNLASYEYDRVGNLLSITRGPVAAPTVTAISPDPLNAGSPTPITITGTGLLLASVTTSNSELEIGQVTGNTETTVETTFTLPNPTTFGPTTVTVTVPGGSVNATLTVAQPAPTINQISPTVGPPGLNVVIDGTGFGTKTGSNRVTFPGAGGARLDATVVNESFTSLTVEVPVGTTSGDVTVEVDTLLSVGAFFTTPGITVIPVTATVGIPANPVVSSANAGQNVQLIGAGFVDGATLDVPVLDQSGVSSIALVPLTNVSPDGTTANIVVPSTATTGEWALSSSSLAGVPVQIIPTTSSLDGTVTIGQPLDILGSGFQEGSTTVLFPGAVGPVTDTDVQGSNDRLTVTVPPGVTGGTVTVMTSGGTSPSVSVGIAVLQAILSVAEKGTPFDPLQPSANGGDHIDLQGIGFTPGLQATFTSTDINGIQGTVTEFILNVSADGTTAEVDLGPEVTTGPVSLGTGFVHLQVVPRITRLQPSGSFEPGNDVVIQGSGIKSGVSTAVFEGSTEVVPTINTVAFPPNTFHRATIPDGVTLVPPGNATTITVTTDGGTSNVFPVSHPVISAITGTANIGTPQDPTKASANVDQEISVTGISFIELTRVTFPDFETPALQKALPLTISPDGLSLTVRVPFDAITGDVSVEDDNFSIGSGTVPLQIVPTIVSIEGVAAEGEELSIIGTGYDPVSTQVQFPGVATPVAPVSVENDVVTVIAPVGTDFTGTLTVLTSGGTSNAFDLSAIGNTELEPNNTTATATPFDIGPPPKAQTETKTGSIDPTGDVDFYRIDIDFIQQGPFYNPVVSLDDPTGPALTLQLTWLDQDGVTVLETTQGTVSSGNDLSLGFTPSANGSYFLKIEETTGQGGSDHTYQVEMNVSLVF